MCLKLTKITTFNKKYDYSLSGNTFQEKLLPYRNLSIDLQSAIVDWFLCLFYLLFFIFLYFIMAFTNLQFWSENQSNSRLTKIKDYKHSKWFCLITYKRNETLKI